MGRFDGHLRRTGRLGCAGRDGGTHPDFVALECCVVDQFVFNALRTLSDVGHSDSDDLVVCPSTVAGAHGDIVDIVATAVGGCLKVGCGHKAERPRRGVDRELGCIRPADNAVGDRRGAAGGHGCHYGCVFRNADG